MVEESKESLPSKFQGIIECDVEDAGEKYKCGKFHWSWYDAVSVLKYRSSLKWISTVPKAIITVAIAN